MNNKALKWIYNYTKSYMWHIVLLACISGVIALGFILLALVSSSLLDIATGNRTGSITLQCFFLFGLILLQAALNIVNSNIRIRVSGKVEMKIRDGLLSSIMKKQYLEITIIHSGELLNRLTSDVKIVVDGVVLIIPQVISIATKIFAGIFVLARLDFIFALIVTALGILMYASSRFYRGRFKYLHKDVQTSDGKTRSFMQECIENVIVIKSFANEGKVKQKFGEYQNNTYKSKIKLNTVSNIVNTSSYILLTSGYFLTLAWGAFQISAGSMTFGTLTAFLQIIEQIKAPFKNMSGLMPQYYSMIASAERLMEVESIKDETYKEDSLEADDLYEKLKRIVFKEVYFSYGKDCVLEAANLIIEKGETIAIAGQSGVGKSTLIKLLLGLMDIDKGSIYFDLGSEVKPIDAGTRAAFTYVPQGNMILSGTIRDNISFGGSEFEEEKLIESAKTACIYDFIKSLPEGFDTVIGERGIGLSEGQAQRLSIARALLSDAPILLLDECTSDLDEATELKVLQNIKALTSKTVICISHRLATINSCDRIIRVENKKVLEDRIHG